MFGPAQIMTKIVALLALWSCVLAAATARVAVEVDRAVLRVPNTPVTLPIDFGALGQLDPASIAVVCGGKAVPIRLSESLERGEPVGTVSWVVRNAAQTSCQVYFNVLARGAKPFRDYREPVGIGDNFAYNRPGGFDPMCAGMRNDTAMAIDWDGDGNVDLLSRILYSTYLDDPWWGMVFWCNVGTNREPRFDRAVRLQADGRVIQDYYATYQLVDWNSDGHTDLLCGIGGGRERGNLKVYLNTGRRDGFAKPVLTSGPRVDWLHQGTLDYDMRLLDWTGRGVLDLFTLRMRVQYFPTQEFDATWYRHPNVAARGAEPRFARPLPLSLGGTTEYRDALPTDIFDVNRDGLPDVVGSTSGLNTKPLRTSIMAWLNTGTREAPAFAKAPVAVIDTTPEPLVAPVVAGTPAFHGLFGAHMGGWLKYYESRAGGFIDRGVLQARGMACSSGGYLSVEVADWEGDGDLDFIVGNEIGYVHLIENISRGGRTMFQTARLIRLTDGTPMYVARWHFIDDADPEKALGQSKPTVVDWDGDGDLDILVGNNSNRIAYFENVGTRQRPRCAPMRKLLHDGGEHFSFRMRPAAADWNGDGLLDLVAGYVGPRNRNDSADIPVCRYMRYRDAHGKLRLGKPEILHLEDGTEFRTPIPYHHGFEVADWDGDGKLDILANQKCINVLYRNVKSNAQPRFRRELLKFYGQPITLSHHETNLKAVDWDRDGSLDLITGGESGMIYFFRRATLEAKERPRVRVGAVELK
jgi:hypothetical protein